MSFLFLAGNVAQPPRWRPNRGFHRALRVILFLAWASITYLFVFRDADPWLGHVRPEDACECPGTFHGEACIFDGLKRRNPQE